MSFIDKQGIRAPMIHEKVAYWADTTPDAVAVRNVYETLTYSQLDRESSALAAYLRAQGIQAGDLVGIFFQPSVSTLVCIIGILKCGAAYVPLDIANPASRLMLMIQQLANLKLIFATAQTAEILKEVPLAVAEIESLRRQLRKPPWLKHLSRRPGRTTFATPYSLRVLLAFPRLSPLLIAAGRI
nr:AMP-binding protein [Pseudomonas sp. FEN]